MRRPPASGLLAAPATGGALFLAAALGPALLTAQDSTRSNRPAVPPGAVIRVEGRGLPLGAEPATVVEQRGDTLVLRPSDGSIAFVPLDRVSRLEVARGQRPRSDGAWRGARVGALVTGLPAALLTGYVAVQEVHYYRGGGECIGPCPVTPYVAAAGLVLTGIGALAGAAIGYAGAPRERWARIEPPLRVGVAPAPRGGAALTAALRF